jgi:hypothetical protein
VSFSVEELEIVLSADRIIQEQILPRGSVFLSITIRDYVVYLRYLAESANETEPRFIGVFKTSEEIASIDGFGEQPFKFYYIDSFTDETDTEYHVFDIKAYEVDPVATVDDDGVASTPTLTAAGWVSIRDA